MSHLPPQNTPPVDASGQMSQAWTQWLAGVARRGEAVPQSVTNSIAAAVAAEAALAVRVTTLEAAETALTGRVTTLETQLAARPSWQVGDYRPSAFANLGTNWLPCDGTTFTSASYPVLESMLATITPVSSTAGQRFLPTIVATFDASHPAPTGPPVMQWWIKAA